MKLIVGNTGLIGKTLKDHITFDREYNSKNIDAFYSENDDLYLSCLPATKWIVNRDPLKDYLNLNSIFNVLRKFSYNRIVLFSTIDVYSNSPSEVDENYSPNISGLNYGGNRFIFENLISTLECAELTILRLPALHGKHIKKNILFDLINFNQIEKINYYSSFQWYDLDLLHEDVEKYKGGTFNLFPEPIRTSEILEMFSLNISNVDSKTTPIAYNFKTSHNESGYVYNEEESLKRIKKFINEFSNK